jgi:HAMP domain-containing protein/signal transduction histidine kinase/PleD family two-component response regulator
MPSAYATVDTAFDRQLLSTLLVFRKGDWSVRLPSDLTGISGKIADVLNDIIDANERVAKEFDWVSRVVGREGKLSQRAAPVGVAGGWGTMVQSINMLIDDLVRPTTEMARIIGAVAKGDLSQSMALDVDGRPLEGQFLRTAKTANTMVEQLSSFASEVTRVAREVGTEGKLGGQAKVKGVAGTWKDLTDSVNSMAGNLTAQVRNIAEVTTAVATGDLSKKITVDVRGEILQLKDTINVMVDQLRSFASEVTRVAREVGTEGRLGGQANVQGVAGTWKDLTDSVNSMASNLTAQVRNIADVTTAVANGNLSKKITVDVKGEILELKNTINVMVDQLNSFASEVTRVAREVGTEGKLGGQAQVRGVGGTWKDLTDSVNVMGANLTAQVRNIAEVTTAVARGDLSKKITVDVKGEILELKDTINVMVDQLSSFAAEVTRVAREVGTEGKLGGQAEVKGVAGTWKDLTDSVNFMAGNLTAQVRNIAEVTTAVARGDLSKKITVDVKGEILELKNTINVMVDQLNSFASEVTRVAQEVGTDGKLGGQAYVQGVAGTWGDLTDSVNSMARNLTAQVRNIAEVTTAVARGDLSKKITVDVKGEILELKNTINVMVDQLNSFASEVTRVAREVGTEGKLGGQAQVRGVGGTWKDLTDSVNSMAGNLTGQVRNIAEVTTAVARGDLSKKITVDVKGEILQLKDTINVMVDQLNSFASEVTRVAREVGTEGKLGGQAQVKGVAGTWKDLTDSVNVMAANLTDQVRNIAGVVTAVAQGELKKKLTVEARGEIAALANTINEMTDTLATFADQVTTVAREVGAEGKLGGQANVPGASGTWKDLTDNVNQLAANLTTQVRAIADVATAVTRGDLIRSVTVAARGEVAVLKDNINEMIRNLKETTQKNAEQDWLKTNLARFTRLLQGQRELETVVKLILSELAPLVGAQLGVFYLMVSAAAEGRLKLVAAYGYRARKTLASEFRPGEGLVGQCALEQKRIVMSSVPREYYRVSSGLGAALPRNAVVLPILFEQEVKAVIELASFDQFSATHLAFLDQLMESIGVVLNNIEANTRTESLLKQSQTLATELQSRQEELQNTNEELAEKARLLSEQYVEVEHKNREVEQARLALEDKAAQLALSSKYKSEFLANMSHELRTPLNSLLILAQQLAENPHRNLSEKQVEYAKIIHGSGTDLLTLINDILDLSKIESGTVTLEISEMRFEPLRDYVERTFGHMAEAKHLELRVDLALDLPPAVMTDPIRLQQILKNLLSNAFKFTGQGSVRLDVAKASIGWSADNAALSAAETVIAFSVSDTGVGIAQDKLLLIFEAFQQADGTTSRRYGGTGLGLSISRELARLLGGEIVVESAVGRGSRFTLYIPFSQASVTATPAVVLPADEGAVRLREDAVLLDLTLPDIDGWAVLDQLKRDADTRHIPVHILSGKDARDRALRQGAFSYLVKPVARERLVAEFARMHSFNARTSGNLLIIEDNAAQRRSLVELLAADDVSITEAGSGAEALAALGARPFDCVVLDLTLPDVSGFELLRTIGEDPSLRTVPVVVYTGKDLSRKEVTQLRRLAQSVIVKDARSPERLLDETALFLHRRVTRLSQAQRRMLAVSYDSDNTLAGKKVLVIDDDVRNIFALTTVLERHQMSVCFSENGKDGIEMLNQAPDIDIVLMDIMMPEMDGYDTTRAIRADPRFSKLPIITLTAKAMKGDREKCIEAGASDYITKPVDTGRLICLLRVWLTPRLGAVA